MRSMLDFSSWHTLFSTAMGLLLASLLMVGIRLVFMQTIQRRRERENRQINERLKTLIAAYKTLGGSFTGTLHVSPMHLRDLRRAPPGAAVAGALEPSADLGDEAPVPTSSERQRRVRDAVEAALSDVVLLGTEEQVQLAAQAAQDMVAGRSIETGPLVVSLRRFIRAALDLEPIPPHLTIPVQGPVRPSSSGGTKRSADGGAGGGGSKSSGGGGAAAGGVGGMAIGAHGRAAADDAAEATSTGH